MNRHPDKKSPAAPPVPLPASNTLAERLPWFKERLAHCADAAFLTFRTTRLQRECALIYFQGMFDHLTLQQSLRDLLDDGQDTLQDETLRRILSDNQLFIGEEQWMTDYEKALQAVMNAHGLVLIDGVEAMLDIPYPSYKNRSIEEAANESVIRGSREAFVEDLPTNLTLLRRRIRNSQLKTEEMIIGERTQTPVNVIYMEGLCPDELVKEMKRRLSYIQIDGVLGSSYLQECIQDTPYSPFPQVQYTERPDTVCASILEGRICVMTENSPIALLAPVTFPMLLQAAEDYYQSFIFASFIRIIRLLFIGVSLLLPSLYIAVTTFHPEMLPYNLLISVSASREIVPFPALMEALMMELAFEALREASIRIPKSIGQAVSIIGALIIGTAAVQAGIVSAAMVIIVSITGIASFIIPNFDLGLTFRLLRFPIMLLAGCFGIFGITCGLLIIYIHTINLKSFGTPYLLPYTPVSGPDYGDTLMRAPWWRMKIRPGLRNRHDSRRQADTSRGWQETRGGENQ